MTLNKFLIDRLGTMLKVETNNIPRNDKLENPKFNKH